MNAADQVHVVSGISWARSLLRSICVAIALLIVAACDTETNLGDLNRPGVCSLASPAESSEQLHQQALAIAVGEGFSCAVSQAGAAYCWGDNTSGQLGNTCEGFGAESPVPVSGLSSGVSAIAAGKHHACAIQFGNVFCWGDNAKGQLGDGSTNPAFDPIPVTVAVGIARELSLGATHSCALGELGTVECWGDNSEGQLGNGSVGGAVLAGNVAGLADVAKLVSGDQHNCALQTSGALLCWGGNAKGQLGNGNNTSNPSATALSGLGAVLDVAAGARHTCVYLGDAAAGGIQCFGDNAAGQLGNGTQSDSNTPVQVMGPDGVGTQLVAGDAHTCAHWLAAGGDGSGTPGLHCWGSNSAGQLGMAKHLSQSEQSPGAKMLEPFQIAASYSRVEELSARGNNTCLRAGGSVDCFGAGELGQLGFGVRLSFDFPGRGRISQTPDATTPGAVLGFARSARSLTAGRNHSCTLIGPGRARCWGSDESGEMGNGGLAEDQLTPGRVNEVLLTEDIVVIDAGGIEGFGSTTCAINVEGAVFCWGYNPLGELAIGSTGNQTTPAAVIGLGLPAVALDAGTRTVCAVLNDGTAACWGREIQGITGTEPVSIVGLNNLVDVGVGWFYFCAVDAQGIVHCQGNNAFGAVGNGSNFNNDTPAPVIGVTDAVSIASGIFHSCVITRRGGLQCWGAGGNGEIGDGGGVDRLTAVDVPGFTSGVTAVSASFQHTCAVKSGQAWCWGSNDYGQLGNNSINQSLVPVPVLGLEAGVAEVAVGQDHSCALLVSGAIRCWGRNHHGQLGDNSIIDSLTAVGAPMPSNTSPSIIYQGDITHPANTQGAQQIAYASAIVGPIEDAGQSMRYGTLVADPDGIVQRDSLGLDSNGDLRYTLTGTNGAAIVAVLPRDNGGEDINGSDLGEPHEFRIFVGQGTDLKLTSNSRCGGVSQNDFSSFCRYVPRLTDEFRLSPEYSYEVANKSPMSLVGARFTLGLSYRFDGTLRRGAATQLDWTCTTSSGNCTPATGSGPVDATFNLAPGEKAFVSIGGTLDPSVRFVELKAQAYPPPGITAFLAQDDVQIIDRAASSEAIHRAGFE